MSILGIVAEYDPFHRGHEHHLLEARKSVSPSAVYIALSPCFRQRGELAMFSPYLRARCALLSGADAVFALPVSLVIRDAERYALGAVSLLSSLGCTHLAFGAETDDLPLLRLAASILDDPPDLFHSVLHHGLEIGMGWPEAQAHALAKVHPEAGILLSRPNNILAVSYLRAIRKIRSGMQPVLVPRSGEYHAFSIDPDHPSASVLRSALIRGDWEHALPAFPAFVREEIRNAFLSCQIPDPQVLDHLLLSRLRSMSPDDARLLPDVSEGLEFRLLNAAKKASSRSELLDLASSRRYPRARISRLCAAALLGIKTDSVLSPVPSGVDEEAVFFPALSEAFLLGLRSNRKMTSRWKDLPVSILSSLKGSRSPFLWEADRNAWRIWAQCASLPDTLPFSTRLEII